MQKQNCRNVVQDVADVSYVVVTVDRCSPLGVPVMVSVSVSISVSLPDSLSSDPEPSVWYSVSVADSVPSSTAGCSFAGVLTLPPLSPD